MAALSEISQTHLSVLFADNVANNPIQRMPIYAEIAVTETLGGPRYSAEDLPLHNAEPENRNRIFHSFSNMVEREIFDALTEDQRMKLIDMLNELVQGLRSDDSFNSASEKQKQQRVDEIVKKAFDGLAIEIRPPERKKRLRSHPLGYIATDHVGYASFDLRNFQKSNLLLDAAFNPLSVEYDFYVYPMSKEGARLLRSSAS